MHKFTYYNAQAGILAKNFFFFLAKIFKKWKDLKLICTIPAIRSHSHPDLKADFLDFFTSLNGLGSLNSGTCKLTVPLTLKTFFNIHLWAFRRKSVSYRGKPSPSPKSWRSTFVIASYHI